VLVHTTIEAETWDRAIVQLMTRRRVALIPTLKLFQFEAKRDGESASEVERWSAITREQLRVFSAAWRGGAVRNRRGLYDRVRSDRGVCTYGASGNDMAPDSGFTDDSPGPNGLETCALKQSFNQAGTRIWSCLPGILHRMYGILRVWI
jgi:hypothetical protein